MEVSIILLNALKYKDKKTGEEKLRLGFCPIGKGTYRNTDNYLGYTELGAYCDNIEVMSELKESDFMQGATLIGEEEISSVNPTKKYIKYTKLITKNATISLV